MNSPAPSPCRPGSKISPKSVSVVLVITEGSSITPSPSSSTPLAKKNRASLVLGRTCAWRRSSGLRKSLSRADASAGTAT